MSVAEDLDRAVDRGPQEIVGLGLLVLGRSDLMSRRNGRHEIAQMPMTERWQARQRRRIGFGIDRYIEIGLVVILVWEKARRRHMRWRQRSAPGVWSK